MQVIENFLQHQKLYVVRQIQLDDDVEDEAWPDFLLCPTKASAKELCECLNRLSFEDYQSVMAEEEPGVTGKKLRDRWIEDRAARYDVSEMDLKELPYSSDLGRIRPSLSIVRRLLPDIEVL